MTTRIIRQSEIKKFKRCRRSWLLAYQRKLSLRTEEESSPAKLGTLVHLGLEHYYRSGTDPLDTIEVEWEGMSEAHKADKKIANRFSYARPMLRAYMHMLEETGADAGWEIVAVEQQIELPFGDILGDEIIVTGKLDLQIVDAFGVPRSVDHKSVATLDVGRVLQVDDQLLTYETLRSLVLGVPTHNAMHNMLRRVKHGPRAEPPFFGRENVTFNETQMVNHLTHMRQTLTELVTLAQYVEAGGSVHAAYPNPTKDCRWDCPFLAVCPMVDDGSDFEGYLSSYYEVRPDVLLSDEDTEEEE